VRLLRTHKNPEPEPMKRARSGDSEKSSKKRKTTVSKPQKAIVIDRGSRSAFKPELKAVSTAALITINSGAGSAGHTVLLNGLVTGANSYNRIGRKIQMKKIQVQISLHPPTPTVTNFPQDLIFFLYVDRDSGALPALADLYQDVAQNGTVSTTVYSQRNLSTTQRFKVLAVKRIPLRICGTATGALPCNGTAFQANQDDLQWTWNIPVNIITTFNLGNTGTYTDIENNAVYLSFFSSVGVGEDPASFDVSTRVRYLD